MVGRWDREGVAGRPDDEDDDGVLGVVPGGCSISSEAAEATFLGEQHELMPSSSSSEFSKATS